MGQLAGVTGSLSTVNTLYTSAREESLRSDLFGSYQKNSRPAPISDIRCNIKLLSIKDLVSACRTYKCAEFDFLNGFINEYLVFFLKPLISNYFYQRVFCIFLEHSRADNVFCGLLYFCKYKLVLFLIIKYTDLHF